MQGFSFKKTLVNGIALIIPVGIILYVFIRLVKGFEKAIAPLAKKTGVDTLFGELTPNGFRYLFNSAVYFYWWTDDAIVIRITIPDLY